VFRTWHVSSTLTFLISCAAIMGLGVLYEALRTYQKTLDARIARELAATVYSFSWDVATASDDTAHTRKAPQG
jgi:copper transporter 1